MPPGLSDFLFAHAGEGGFRCDRSWRAGGQSIAESPPTCKWLIESNLCRDLNSQVMDHVDLGDEAIKNFAVVDHCDSVGSKNRHQII